eukprot:scaffold39661_cov63-Cyclotella_meneghiniana.AAC.16
MKILATIMTVTRGATASSSGSNRTAAETSSVLHLWPRKRCHSVFKKKKKKKITVLMSQGIPILRRNIEMSSRKACSSVASHKGGKTKGGKTIRRVTLTLGMPPRFRHARPLPPRVELPSADLLDPLSFPQRHNATQKLETALDALANTQDYIEKLQEKLQEFEEYSTAVFSDLNQLSVDAANKDANNKALDLGNKALKTELSLLKKNVARQDQIIKKLNQELKVSQKSSKRVDEIAVAQAKADISVDTQHRKLLNQDKAKSASKKRSEEEKSHRLEQLKKRTIMMDLIVGRQATTVARYQESDDPATPRFYVLPTPNQGVPSYCARP